MSEMRPRRRTDGGYVAAMTALLLIPLMLFAALATDVGAWYVKADQTQAAADAAALAGTVWLPDTNLALEVARDVAARNGFRDPAWVAVNGGTANATVTSPGLTPGSGLIIEIETTSPSFFGSLVLNQIDITRRAAAEVTTPVRMGNPSNALGTGNLSSSELGITPDGVWLSLNGWCQDHQQGDPVSVGYYGSVTAGGYFWDACGGPNLGANPTFNADGYTFVVDVPSGAGAVAIEVFEPGVCFDSNTSDDLYSAEDGWYTNGPRLNFRVYANDSTPLTFADNLATTPVADTLYSLSDCTGGSGAGGRWYTLYTIPSAASSEGQWFVQASVRANVAEYSLNSFALRARPTTDTQLCSSMTDASCPVLYALDWLSVFRPNFSGGFAGQPAEFFLAEISDDYAGKAVEITMFDPGEGMDNIQFLDPAGNEVDFDFRLANCSVGQICTDPVTWPETLAGPNDSCSGVPCLDVTGSRFQDQWIVMTSNLDASYSCGSNCWWKVRYTPVSGGSVTDRTTWSVAVVGDPVHLTD